MKTTPFAHRIPRILALLLLTQPFASAPAADAPDEFLVPASTETLCLRLPEPGPGRLPEALGRGPLWVRGEGLAARSIPVARVPAIGPDGTARSGSSDWILSLPGSAAAGGERRLGVEAGASPAPARFRFQEDRDQTLSLREGDQPVFVYRQGVTSKPGVPADRARASYVHPLYGLDGEVLTDDFPEDHHHHRGLFWSWPHVGIAGKQYDLWMLKGITNRFERWMAREAGPAGAVLGVENGWYVGEAKVMLERIWLTVYPVADGRRAIDVDCTWIPQGQPVSLAGAEGKSYGGMTIRYAPGTNTVITTPLGQGTNDLYMTALPWADFSRRFEGRTSHSGAALFVAQDHPDYPPTWLTRHYGVLCLGWPGVSARTFPPGLPIRCRYRVWVHRGTPSQAEVGAAYAAYTDGLKARPVRPPRE